VYGVAVPILPWEEPVASSVPMQPSSPIAAGNAVTGERDVTAMWEPVGSPTDAHHAHGIVPAMSRQEAVAMVWLTGVVAFIAVASVKTGRTMRRLTTERMELPAPLHHEIRELLGSLGEARAPRVWLVPSGSQPFVWGLWRGDIFLPVSFASLGDPEHRRDILAHELSHVLRRDAAVNLLQILAQAIFWFHPFVWWANVKIRQEREKCCDEMAIARLGAKPRSYSRAIVEALLVERASNEFMPSLAIAGSAKNIEERIKTMLRPGKQFYRRPSLLAAACALALALLIVPTSLALTSRPADNAPTAEQIEQQRAFSTAKLKKFALGLITFAQEHGGRYPAHSEISWVSEDDPDNVDVFLLEKVQYLGTGKTRPTTNAFGTPLAFDIPLLRVAGGTNVAFADGHVEFITTDQLAARGVTIPKVSLEITDVRFEPIHQGKNIVHVTVKNTSNEEQLFAAHIYTRSPDYGVPVPEPDHSGVGWGTGGYFNTLKPGQTKALRLAFKIQGPITDRTYVNLRFSNPETQKAYDGKWYFYSRKYMSVDLPKAAKPAQTPASPSETQAVTQAFSQIQRYIQDRQYEQAWERFSQDYQTAEYQRDGLAAFRKAMEPTHPLHSGFTWERGNFLKLKAGQVSKHDGVLALAADVEEQTWTLDFVREDNQLKVDGIVGYVPAVLKMQEEDARERAAKAGNLKVLDVQFEPVREGKNVVRAKVQNTSGADQTFGIDIRTEGPLGNWQRQFTEAMKAKETKLMTFNFEISGPVADATTVRLRFCNPATPDQVDADDYFEQRRYTSKELPLTEDARKAAGPVMQAEKDAVTKAFTEFQNSIRGQDYQRAWNLTSEHLRSRFGNDIERFKGQMGSGGTKDLFLSLRPRAVTRLGAWLTLETEGEYEAMNVHFIQEGGQWRIYEGQMNTKNWEDRILPKMEKRSTAHFDIYYPKGSAAAREIDRIAKQKDTGFEQICQFVGKDSDIRIRMVFFEDGSTKQRATGHQGAGWAYGHTIVEIYNDQEKSDPYHETAHILMGALGGPPALFNEGFAVYLSEKLGVRALEGMGGGQATIYQRVKELKSKGDWIELPQLLTFTQIGPAESRPPVAYPEAASFVKFLIDTYGKDKFLQAYQTLQNSGSKTVQEENAKKLEQICGKPLPTLQQQWEAAFTRS